MRKKWKLSNETKQIENEMFRLRNDEKWSLLNSFYLPVSTFVILLIKSALILYRNRLSLNKHCFNFTFFADFFPCVCAGGRFGWRWMRLLSSLTHFIFGFLNELALPVIQFAAQHFFPPSFAFVIRFEWFHINIYDEPFFYILIYCLFVTINNFCSGECGKFPCLLKFDKNLKTTFSDLNTPKQFNRFVCRKLDWTRVHVMKVSRSRTFALFSHMLIRFVSHFKRC